MYTSCAASVRVYDFYVNTFFENLEIQFHEHSCGWLQSFKVICFFFQEILRHTFFYSCGIQHSSPTFFYCSAELWKNHHRVSSITNCISKGVSLAMNQNLHCISTVQILIWAQVQSTGRRSIWFCIVTDGHKNPCLKSFGCNDEINPLKIV